MNEVAATTKMARLGDHVDLLAGFLSKRKDSGLPVPVAFALSVRHAVAGTLRALDDKIEQNQWTAQALARLARAIFRAWFVDFEPVMAKTAGGASFPGTTQAACQAG